MTGQRPRADLVAAWEETHGRPPPKGLSTRLLILSAAYCQQAEAYGALPPSLREGLLAIADPNHAARAAAPDLRNREKPAMVKPGTRLIREWRGEAHIVDVLADGVLYCGATYPSLSAVARQITGARWSGPRFFGLCTQRQRR